MLLIETIPQHPRPEDRSIFKIPGGSAKNNKETPEETGKREFREETGRKIRSKTELERVVSIVRPGHSKLGYMVDDKLCKGRLYKKGDDLVYERKTRIIGWHWKTFEEALRLIPRASDNDHYHMILLMAREKLLVLQAV